MDFVTQVLVGVGTRGHLQRCGAVGGFEGLLCSDLCFAVEAVGAAVARVRLVADPVEVVGRQSGGS